MFQNLGGNVIEVKWIVVILGFDSFIDFNQLIANNIR